MWPLKDFRIMIWMFLCCKALFKPAHVKITELQKTHSLISLRDLGPFKIKHGFYQDMRLKFKVWGYLDLGLFKIREWIYDWQKHTSIWLLSPKHSKFSAHKKEDATLNLYELKQENEKKHGSPENIRHKIKDGRKSKWLWTPLYCLRRNENITCRWSSKFFSKRLLTWTDFELKIEWNFYSSKLE